jgi:hypothetical protein
MKQWSSVKYQWKLSSLYPPDSSFKAGWDLTGLFFILYEAIVIPYRVGFNVSSAGFFFVIELMIDIFFITDMCNSLNVITYNIVINFNTGYYKRGNLIMRRRKIIRKYLKTWFALDLLATMPYSWFI